MESMKPCVLILSNSDSGLYDFRREVLQALLDEGRRVLVPFRIPAMCSASGHWAANTSPPPLKGGA